jgi:hypothetical protein
VLGLLKIASIHYRFLLYLICSSSFKDYFELMKASFGQSMLPDRKLMKVYLGQVADAEVVNAEVVDAEVVDAEVVDAEVEVDWPEEDEAPFEGVS